jgi:mannose-binding lectin 2
MRKAKPVQSGTQKLQVQFRVSGTTKDLFGDGFSIWYTRDQMEDGPVFGNRDFV